MKEKPTQFPIGKQKRQKMEIPAPLHPYLQFILLPPCYNNKYAYQSNMCVSICIIIAAYFKRKLDEIINIATYQATQRLKIQWNPMREEIDNKTQLFLELFSFTLFALFCSYIACTHGTFITHLAIA